MFPAALASLFVSFVSLVSVPNTVAAVTVAAVYWAAGVGLLVALITDLRRERVAK